VLQLRVPNEMWTNGSDRRLVFGCLLCHVLLSRLIGVCWVVDSARYSNTKLCFIALTCIVEVREFTVISIVAFLKPAGMQASNIQCLSQARINWGEGLNGHSA